MAVSGSVPGDTESGGLGSVPGDTSADSGAPSPTASVMSDAIDPPFPGSGRREPPTVPRHRAPTGGRPDAASLDYTSFWRTAQKVSAVGGGRGVADSGREVPGGSGCDPSPVDAHLAGRSIITPQAARAA